MNGSDARSKKKGPFTVISIVIVIIFTLTITFYLFWSDMNISREKAPDFEILTENVNITRLGDLEGNPVILHFTNIENPLCLECEKVLEEQVREISKAHEERSDLNVITINMRKNPYSERGDELVRKWWGINVTWIWLEDGEPFPVSGKYTDYWSLSGGSVNPTILLLDEDLYVVGIYHVYQMGKGEIDGVVTSDRIIGKIEKIEQGEWEGVEGERAALGSGSVLGMFMLGVVTSFSPCSIALLFSVFTFMFSRRREQGSSQTEGSTTTSKGAREGFLAGSAFVLGMAAVFFIMGILIARLGVFVQGARYFDIAAGIILLILGVNNVFSITELLQDVKERFFTGRKRRTDVRTGLSFKERVIDGLGTVFVRSPVGGAFLLGIFFSLGWAPCAVSLVLPVVVWMMAQDIPLFVGGLLFFFFGLGHGIIIIPLSVGTSSFSARLAQRFVNAAKWTRIIFGIMVIAMGVIFSLRFFGVKLW